MGTLPVILLSTMMLVLETWAGPAEPLIMALNTRRPSHIVSDHFVSLTINPTDLLQGRPFGMGGNQTLRILKGLSPAYIRLGGPDTNRYVFKNPKAAEDSPKSTDEIIVTEDYWKNLNDFFRKTGIDVVVCLNSGHRNSVKEKWDPRNALQLITYSDRHQYNLTWQLGYEPLRADETTGTQFGKDISQLRAILNAFPRYQQAKIVGPDVRTLHRKEDVDHVLEVLIEAGPAINAVTWHPRWPHVSAITPSDTSSDAYDFPPDYLEWDRNHLHKLLQRSLLKKAFWISEPKGENTGTFAEGLMYARRLAIAAKLGIEVVMKQPILDDVTHPKPEYWVALLHKKSLGRTVLETHSLSNQSEVSVVAQCTPKAYADDEDGGVTIFTVNTASSERKLVMRGMPHGHIGDEIHQYILTAGENVKSIFSQVMYLNDEPLLMTEEGEVPALRPKIKHMTQNLLVKLPPYSIGIWVAPRAKVKICQQEPTPFVPLIPEDLGAADVIKTTQKGMNSLRSISKIFVDTLLNPTANTGGRTANEIPDSKVRKSRQVDPEELGRELKKRLEEMQTMLKENIQGFRTNFARASEDEEKSLRATERKIDSIAQDLGTAMKGANQETEFGKFLELSGLKTDFGQMMMDQQLQNNRQQFGLSSNRNKRDLSTNSLLKGTTFDLNEIEKRYQKLFEKHAKSMGQNNQMNNMEFGIINKELQEEVLLKEITMLEKTEDSITDLMKNHQERVEAVEDLLREELEELKEEKLAALIKIKSDIKAKEHSNEVLPDFALKPKREIQTEAPAVEGTTTEAPAKKSTILTAVKTFFEKKKEELNKRRNTHEKLLEAQRKSLKEFQEKTKRISTKPEEKEVTTKAEDAQALEVTEAPLVAATQSKGEIKKEAILKVMSDMIVKKKPDEEAEENTSDTSEETAKETKSRKSRMAHYTTKTQEKSKYKRENGQQHFQNEKQTFRDSAGKEANVAEAEHQGLQQISGSEQQGLQQISGAEQQGLQQISGAERQVSKQISGAEQQVSEQISGTEAGQQRPGSEKSVSGDEGLRESKEEEGTRQESATKNFRNKQENSKRKSLEERFKRSAATTDFSTSSSAEVGELSQAHGPELDTNAILKKINLEDALKGGMKPNDMLSLASSTLKMVLEKVIPKSYSDGKVMIGDMGLPEYLLSLGKMVENFQRIDELIRTIENIEAAENESPSGSENIQKIRRTRRDTDLENHEAAINNLANPQHEELTRSAKDEDELNNLKFITTTSLPDVTAENNVANASISKPQTNTETAAADFQVANATGNNKTAEETNEEDEELKAILLQNPGLNKAMEKIADEILEKEAVKPSTDDKSVVDEDPTSPRLLVEQQIVRIIDELLKQEQVRNKEKRAIQSPLTRLTRGLKRNAGTPPSYAFPPPSPYALQPPAQAAVSQYLQKLRPGVYVVPSKDMKNVHAEQTAKTLEAAKNGDPQPNVVTLNIFYDKTASKEEKEEEEEKEEPASIPAVNTQHYYRYSSSPTWNAGQLYKPATAYPTLPVVAPPAVPVIPSYATYRKLQDPRYPALPAYQQRAYPYRPAVNKYNPYYSQNLKPYDSNSIYEQPNPLKQSSPKLIPVTPFDTWNKPKTTEEDVSWLIQAEDRPVSEQVKPEDDDEVTDFLKKALETAVEETVKEVEEEKKAESETPDLDKRKTIETYWNRTLREIFQETANDTFWNFLDKPSKNPSPSPKTKDASLEEPAPASRRKRSLDLATSFINPESSYDYNAQNVDAAWLTGQKEAPYDYYVQENELTETDPYRRDRRNVENNLVVKDRRKSMENPSLPSVYQGLQSQDYVGSAQEIVPMSNGESVCPEYFSVPVKQIYDLIVDFIKRVANAS